MFEPDDGEGPLEWEELRMLLHKQGYEDPDYKNGRTRSQSRLRLFGHSEKSVKVTLFRDHHGWCGYC